MSAIFLMFDIAWSCEMGQIIGIPQVHTCVIFHASPPKHTQLRYPLAPSVGCFLTKWCDIVRSRVSYVEGVRKLLEGGEDEWNVTPWQVVFTRVENTNRQLRADLNMRTKEREKRRRVSETEMCASESERKTEVERSRREDVTATWGSLSD